MTGYLLFGAAVLLLAYVYAGYPLIAVLRGYMAPASRQRAPIRPTVSILVVGYNEAEQIERRIQNLLELDYLCQLVEIVIASDGSTDDMVARALRCGAPSVRVIPFAMRRGKAAVINEVVPTLRGEIVLFADARQRFEPNALTAIVDNFADPEVGAVSGELMLLSENASGAATKGTSFYWRYEKLIRASEGKADSTVGATGAIYAIRRSLFQPIPDDTLLDDVLIPMRIVKQGYRVLFEPEARAFDTASKTAQQEFARKVRTIAGNFQLFSRERWLLSPRQNRLWLETVSHKGLRLLLPLLHLAVLLTTFTLPRGVLFGVALGGQLVFYAAALIGSTQAAGTRGRASLLFSVPYATCLLCWATIVGFVRFVTNRQKVTWERAAQSVGG